MNMQNIIICFILTHIRFGTWFCYVPFIDIIFCLHLGYNISMFITTSNHNLGTHILSQIIISAVCV